MRRRVDRVKEACCCVGLWEQRRSDWRWRVGSNRSRRRLVRLVQGPYVHAAAETREGKKAREGPGDRVRAGHGAVLHGRWEGKTRM